MIMFYDLIGEKRDMKIHIGLQELNDQSKVRVKLINILCFIIIKNFFFKWIY